MKNTKDFYNKTAIEWADKWYQDETDVTLSKRVYKQIDLHGTYILHNK